MKRIGNYFLFILIYFFGPFLHADVSLKIEVQPQEVAVGETLAIVLKIQSSEDMTVEEPSIPQIEGLSFLGGESGGQSQSTSMSIINGQVQYEKNIQETYILNYQAKKAGFITIPSIKVKVNGQLITSSPQKISVSKTPAQNKQNRRDQEDDFFGSQPMDDFDQLLMQRQKRMLEEMQKQMNNAFGIPPGGFNSQQNPNEIPQVQIENFNSKEAFHVMLEADKSTAFEGEQVTAKWYLYTNSNIETLDRAKFPDLKGFWKEIIEEIPVLQFENVIVNGIPYRRALLASHALFPIKAGTVTIDEFKIKAKVRMRTQFGFGDVYEYTKSSRRWPIKVLPLPQEGKPLSFSGAVGEFQVLTQVDQTSVPQGQPLTVKIRFEGQGNAKLIEMPPIDWSENVEVYDTKSNSKFFKNGQSFKEFEILMIPKKEGALTIPSVQFSYFDPVLKQYITKSTESFEVLVTAPTASAPVQIYKKGATQIKAIKTAHDIELFDQLSSYRLQSLLNPFRLMIISLFTLLSYAFLFLIQKYQLRNINYFKIDLQSRMNKIKSYFKQNDYAKFSYEGLNLVYVLSAHLAHEKGATQNWETLIRSFSENDKLKYEKRLLELLHGFEQMSFAPELQVDKIEFNQSSVQESIKTDLGRDQKSDLSSELLDKLSHVVSDIILDLKK